MDAPGVDWSTAKVSGETLTVDISGELADGFQDGFELSGRLLAADTPFGAPALDGATVTVEHVRPGSEEQVRFLVEGAVLQANADVERGRSDDAADSADVEDAGDGDGGPDEVESQMTERLRGFADADAEPAEPRGDDPAGG